MAKQKTVSWYTMEKDNSKMILPMNRKARKAYQKNNNQERIMKPIMMPYKKENKNG